MPDCQATKYHPSLTERDTARAEKLLSLVAKVSNDPNQRKVLILEEDASTRETIRVLLGSIGYQCVFVSSVEQALELLERERVDVAILSPQPAGFSQLILRLRDRVIVVTDANRGRELDDLIRQYSLPHIQRDRLVTELFPSLDALTRPSTVFEQVRRVARLIFDSFLQPLQAGVRNSPRAVRRLVYECGPLSVDVSFEPKMDRPHIELVGQILDSSNSGHSLEGLPVVLQGQKGAIAMTMTNEFGEFSVDFRAETNVNVEIETSKSHWVTLVSPSLDWASKAAGGAV